MISIISHFAQLLELLSFLCGPPSITVLIEVVRVGEILLFLLIEILILGLVIVQLNMFFYVGIIYEVWFISVEIWVAISLAVLIARFFCLEVA